MFPRIPLASYPELTQLCQVLQECQADEILHRDEARASLDHHLPDFFYYVCGVKFCYGDHKML